MSVLAPMLPGFLAEEREIVSHMTIAQAVDRACKLLREHEPQDGYYLAFSGGKDSVVIDRLCQLSGVKYTKHYANTTIDAPETIRFIREYHADAAWNMPKCSMMHKVATAPKVPPTRGCRWCCSIYKECAGPNRIKVLGVRASESEARSARWVEFHDFGTLQMRAIAAPIVYWTDAQVWGFIHDNNVPYCELYDQGFTRLGCVGCPLTGPEGQTREFARWPRYEANWRRAILANWEKWHDVPRQRDGEPRYQWRFASAEALWEWWRWNQPPAKPVECMSESLFTNA